jgi:hypothetical protein
MKKQLGDHIGKKRGWAWFEAIELIKLAIKNPRIVKAVKSIFKKK